MPRRPRSRPINVTDYPPGVVQAVRYAASLESGDIPACKLAVAAARRFLDDLRKAEGGRGEWEFRAGAAEAAMLFASLLPNIKGPLAGKPLVMEPWQCFILTNVFGFYERGTEARRFRQAVVFVPRGNGKTTVAAPIALYLTFCEGEGGAEGYAAAVTRGQARILFDTAQEMVRRSPEFRSEYGVDTLENAIFQRRSASKFVPVSSDAKALDGLNVHVAVCDEIASHRTSQVYDVLLTAMGKRLHPLLISISTATANNAGIGRSLWSYAARVLEGRQADPRLFALIHAADDTDDIWDERTWRKANPNWGVSVQPDAVRAIARQARNNPVQESAFKTRHLNLWVGADDALFSMRAWRACARPELRIEDFAGRHCDIAVDLAAKTDLAAVQLTFSREDPDTGQLHYTTFGRFYTPESVILEGRQAEYAAWAAGGHMVVTPGNEIDFSTIEEHLLEDCARFRVGSVAYDPWSATQLAQRLSAQAVPVIEFRATTQNFSEPTKELDAAMQASRIEHDGNPVLEWCIGNVVGHYDPRGNVYPRKARPEQKIDGAITLIMTLGRAMTAREEIPYADGRGLLIV